MHLSYTRKSLHSFPVWCVYKIEVLLLCTCAFFMLVCVNMYVYVLGSILTSFNVRNCVVCIYYVLICASLKSVCVLVSVCVNSCLF